MSNIQIVIMAGGTGKRFWPFSTPQCPKQFIDLTGNGTLFQQTLNRAKKIASIEDIWVLTNERYEQIVLEQCNDLNPTQIIGEPLMRDTAAAIALGAGLIAKKDPNAIMAVFPADHLINNTKGFASTVEKAGEQAKKGLFVTIGIKPTYPAEGFGYLEKGKPLESPGCYNLKRFVEKPNREIAKEYVNSNNYFWNAGMYLWKVDKLITQLKIHLPKHAEMAKNLSTNIKDSNWQEKAKKEFEKLEKISIDYGLMEKIKDISTVESQFDWNDLGGWLALEDLLYSDENKNCIKGKIITQDSHNNIIISDDNEKPVIISDIKDSVIISSKSGILVCSKNNVERIKDLVEKALAK